MCSSLKPKTFYLVQPKPTLMKKLLVLALLFSMVNTACNYRRIKGSGNIISEQRSIGNAHKIKLEGSYDVELAPGQSASLKVEGDDNILPYIITQNEGGWLVIKSKDHINFSTKNPLKVYITTDMLEAISLSGSGNIVGTGRFAGAEKLEVKISGVGNAKLEVNAPFVSANISGSGSITLIGETKDAKINISGIGSYKGIDLKAENAEVRVSGSGSATVFAENKLDVHVSGIGDVNYKGNATVSQHVSGNGSVKKIQ